MKRMRCSHCSGVIFLAMITAIAWPTPHHRLWRSLSSRRSLWVSASANYRHPPCLIITPNHRPRGSGQRSWTRGRAQHDHGGKQETNGGKLAFIRAVQAFSCHGVARATPCFHPIDFHATCSLLWYFLGRQESTVSPRSPVFPYLPKFLKICKSLQQMPRLYRLYK